MYNFIFNVSYKNVRGQHEKPLKKLVNQSFYKLIDNLILTLLDWIPNLRLTRNSFSAFFVLLI